MDTATLLGLYGRALDGTGRIVARVRDEALGWPTPCTEWNVATLLNRLIEVNWWFAGVRPGRCDERPGVDRRSRAEEYRRAAAAALATFAEPATAARTFVLAAGQVPGSTALWIALATASVHGWDLATATGQEPTIPPDIAEPLLEFMTGFVTDDLRRPPRSLFAAAVPVAADAGPSDRLVAFLGRRP